MNLSLPTIDRFVPAIFGVLVTVFGAIFFLVKQGDKSISVKFFVLYTIGAIVVFALISLESFTAFRDPFSLYFYNQLCFLLLGAFHTFLLTKLIGIEENESFIPELAFTLYVAFLGGAIIAAGLVFLNHGANGRYAPIFASSLFALIIPWLFYRTYIFLVWIPAPLYKKWYYPVGEEVDISDDMFEDKNIVVLKYSIQRTAANAKDIIDLRMRAPLRIELGKFFRIGIDNNNEGDAGRPIEFCDEFSQPFGWNFYIRPKWYQSPRYLDPDLTIAENELKEGEVVVAERITD
jgi:hypothetical protein